MDDEAPLRQLLAEREAELRDLRLALRQVKAANRRLASGRMPAALPAGLGEGWALTRIGHLRGEIAEAEARANAERARADDLARELAALRGPAAPPAPMPANDETPRRPARRAASAGQLSLL